MLGQRELNRISNRLHLGSCEFCTCVYRKKKKEKRWDEAAYPWASCQREKVLTPATGAKPILFCSFKVKVGLSRENPIVLNDSVEREVEYKWMLVSWRIKFSLIHVLWASYVMSMRVSRLTPACQGLFNGIIINSIFDPSMCLPYLSGGHLFWLVFYWARGEISGGRQTDFQTTEIWDFLGGWDTWWGNFGCEGGKVIRGMDNS